MEDTGINTVEGKKLLVTNFMNQMRDFILAEVPKMPKEWDGIELRWYIERAFLFEAPQKEMGMKYRFRDFEHDAIRAELNY